MSRILAIETDSKRRILLATLIRGHITADLTVVSSVQAALSVLAKQTPDLILAPTLLSPKDGDDLIARVRELNAPYVQVVTLPALDMLIEPPKETRRGFAMLRRRPVSLGLQYDPQMVVTQIADGLDRARTARAEHEAMLAHAEWRKQYLSADAHALVPSRLYAAEAAARLVQAIERSDDRRTALRRSRTDLPWLSGIRLAWGSQVDLVNISSSGVLLETGSKFAPGSTTELHLDGPETNLVVPVRFIRSDVARIDGLGVKYHAAAAFDKELDLGGSRPRLARTLATPQALAELLSDVLVPSDSQKDLAHVRFARGIRQLVRAADVQVRRGSSSSGGRETLYFDVPGDARTTLQVVFERNHDVTETEFRMLRAAAWMTAAVLEFEKPQNDAVREPEVKMLAEAVA